jgi:hypothetical protein
MTRLKWKLVSFRLEIVLILMQDGCTVCAEHTIDSKNILDAPDGTPTIDLEQSEVWCLFEPSDNQQIILCAYQARNY